MKLFSKNSAPTSLLGLSLDGGRLDAVLLRRTNGSVVIQKTASAALTLDVLNNEAELAGGELRNLLDAAGIKERRCVVCLPASWALSVSSKLPELAPEDVESFLQIEAERGFPRSTDELQVSASRYRTPGGDSWVTQVAVIREHLERLEEVLEAAGLKPLGFSLGLPSLPGAIPDGPRGLMCAMASETSVDIQVACGGGLVTLRSLGGAFDGEGGEKRLQSDLVARELRITLGQLPADVRESVRELKIFGTGRFAEQLAIELRPRLAAMGLPVEHIATHGGEVCGLKVPAGTAISAALSLAARYLARQKGGFEFLPPKQSVWRQFAARHSSRRLALVGATAGAAAAVFIGLFVWQQVQLTNLKSKWAGMKKSVDELEAVQKKIRKFRPWYDESFTSMSILRRVTEAFPEDGTVSAKTIEIRNLVNVSCTGTTRDNASLFRATDKLTATPEVKDLKTDVIRGKSPMQFTFNFHWGTARKNEN